MDLDRLEVWLRYAKYRVRKVFKHTFVPKPLQGGFDRWLDKGEIDGYIVSFPKCGRTWVHVILEKAFKEYYLDDFKSERLFFLKEIRHLHPAIPYLKKTHDEAGGYGDPDFESDVTPYERSQVIWLVRHPLDVLVSYYHQLNKRKQIFDGTLADFIEASDWSIDRIINFYNTWTERYRELEDVLLVRYEDMHEDAERELDRIFEFLDLTEIPQSVRREAVEHARFEKMKRREKKDQYGRGILEAKDKEKNDTYKVRKGQIGSYKDELPEGKKDLLREKIENDLSDFFEYTYDYEPHTA